MIVYDLAAMAMVEGILVSVHRHRSMWHSPGNAKRAAERLANNYPTASMLAVTGDRTWVAERDPLTDHWSWAIDPEFAIP